MYGKHTNYRATRSHSKGCPD